MRGPLFVAGRIFLRRRRDHRQGHPLIGAALGIALSLIPLVTVDHVADSMIEGIIGRYRETSSYHFQTHAWGDPTREEFEEMARGLSELPETRGAWIERQGFGLARGESTREGLTLRALSPEIYTRDPSFEEYIQFDSGEWNLDSGNSILLGREASRRLGVSVDDTLRILTAKRLPDGRYVPRVSAFRVTGIFSSGYQDLDRTWAFIPLETGWRILSSESSKTFIGGKLPSTGPGGEAFYQAVSSFLPNRWSIYSWRELNRYLLSNLESTRGILLFIMGLIIIIAVMNVMTSLVMLTLERRREIGILKCTGTSPFQITRSFVFAGLLASGVGTLAGLGGGLLAACFINEIIAFIELILGLFSGGSVSLLNEGYYLQHIPVQMRWTSTLVIGLSTFLLSLAAAAVPASRAAKLKPLDVMRKH